MQNAKHMRIVDNKVIKLATPRNEYIGMGYSTSTRGANIIPLYISICI